MREDYVQRRYIPTRNEIIVEYFLEPAYGYTFKQVANAVAGESSIDTWTDIKTLSPQLAKKLRPHVFQINEKTKIMKIAHPIALFENGSVAQLLSSISGNILSMKMVQHIRLLDVHFPKPYVDSFLGPKFGISGIRKIIGVNRPLLGTIVKPKMGLTPKEHALVAYNSWIGGLDVVKDDENLTDQSFNPFKQRVKTVLNFRNKAERLTDAKKIYMPNITAPTTEEMLKRAEYVKSLGGEYVMVDIITSGWTSLQSLRKANEKLKLVLHAHRCMHSAYTRSRLHGVSMMVVAKLTRLIGFDQLHTGTIIGKMDGDSREVLDIDYEMEHQTIEENDLHHILRQKWYNLKPLLPVASGGIHPIHIPKLYKYFGKDIVLQFGGGVHAHPSGTEAGAKAAVQALEAAMKHIPLKDYAKSHKELEEALRKWG